MAYNGDRLSQVVSTIEGQGPSVWSYITADSLATVKGASYFSDFVKRGGRKGDLIMASIGTLNTAVYPSSGAATADVGEAADFTAQPQSVLLQASSVSGDAATVLGVSADLGTGVLIGDAAASTVGFYGATAVSQRASSIQATSVISAYSATTASALIGALLVEIANTLNGLGIWKGAA